jgi:hypothetical protein
MAFRWWCADKEKISDVRRGKHLVINGKEVDELGFGHELGIMRA